MIAVCWCEGRERRTNQDAVPWCESQGVDFCEVEDEPFVTFPAQANCRHAEGSVFSGTF